MALQVLVPMGWLDKQSLDLNEPENNNKAQLILRNFVPSSRSIPVPCPAPEPSSYCCICNHG